MQAVTEFRPSKISTNAVVESVSLVLCNDKPQTFGAPDVLQASADHLALQYSMDQQFADRPADQAAQLQLRVLASFLNNSSSR